MKKEFCVISHTHWDREWYFTFEQFRYRLVKLMDNLLEIMENEPKYIFHLDAQTIVLEDYLKIKPYNREKLEKYIKEGRIIPGPWYVQNDFYLTDGEATIRNLLIGTEIAQSFGGCGNTGYIPDQFGNISQLPQIFNGFGIESCLLGRGYSFYDADEEGKLKRNQKPCEFYWNGKDGSRVFTVRFTNWYNNAQRFYDDADKNIKLLEGCVKAHEGTDKVPYYLLMNGVDHLEAQENLLELLPEINEKLTDGVVKQCTMKEYTDKAQAFVEENNIDINNVTGELRSGNAYDMLKGTLSSRVYLKIANAKAQNKIENAVEPLYAYADALGFEKLYPDDYLGYLWKLLIENHPHDSICGCSVDGVHRNMMDRTARFNETADTLIHDALETLTAHVSRDGMNEEDYLITVWNTSESVYSGTVVVDCNFPMTEGFSGFDILDENGEKMQFDCLRRDDYTMRTTSPINLPGEIDCDSFLIRLYVPEIGAMSYKAYVVKKNDGELKADLADEEKNAGAVLENDLFKLAVNEMGEIDVTHKKSGRTYKNFISLADDGEKGDLYVHHHMDGDIVVETKNIKPDSITVTGNTDIEKSCVITYTLDLPECVDFNKYKRSTVLVKNTVKIGLSLIKGHDYVDINCTVDNKSSDHRLRILFNTGLNTDFTTSFIPFDTIERDRREVLKKVCDGTQPNSGFIHIGNENEGIGILNEGLYEYEHLLGDEGTVAVTLLRCAGIITIRPNRYRRNMTRTFDSQCIGEYSMHLGVCFDEGDKKQQISRLVRKYKQFANGVISHFQPYNVRKFTGGRPQMQGSDIEGFFFREDKYKDINLGKSGKLFEIEGDAMALSAFKKSVDGKMLVVRLYNTTDEKADFAIKLGKKLSCAYKLTMSEKNVCSLDVKDNKITLEANPREIVTLGFELNK